MDTELSFLRKIREQARLERETEVQSGAISGSGGGAAGGNSFQVMIQTPIRGHGHNILTKADLLAHVEMMLSITRMQIEMHGV